MRRLLILLTIVCPLLLVGATGCEQGNLQKKITDGEKTNLIPEGATNVEYKGPNYVQFTFEGSNYLLFIGTGESNTSVAALTELSTVKVPDNKEGENLRRDASESTIQCVCPRCKARLAITPLGPVEIID